MLSLTLNMSFYQLPGGLDLRNILKRILWDQKKAPGVKIQVKKISRLFKGAEILPIPPLAALFCFQQNTLVFQAKRKGILEGGRSFIDAQR